MNKNEQMNETTEQLAQEWVRMLQKLYVESLSQPVLWEALGQMKELYNANKATGDLNEQMAEFQQRMAESAGNFVQQFGSKVHEFDAGAFGFPWSNKSGPNKSESTESDAAAPDGAPGDGNVPMDGNPGREEQLWRRIQRLEEELRQLRAASIPANDEGHGCGTEALAEAS